MDENEHANNGSLAKVKFSSAICAMLEKLGIELVFGVSGGAIAHLWEAVSLNQNISFFHCRQESGASFAAIEAYFANDKPTAILVTTGPGLMNALNGLFAAKWEGAKVILISGFTPKNKRGRRNVQETSYFTLTEGIYTAGPLFDFVSIIESAETLPFVYRKLAAGLQQPGGFVAHISIPIDLQSELITSPNFLDSIFYLDFSVSSEVVKDITQQLLTSSFAIWVGWGARKAAQEVRLLAEATSSPVLCSAHAKGIFPENHPQFVGVTGLAGGDYVLKYMEKEAPERILVLGSWLGETTSYWNSSLIPKQGFVHIDIKPFVPGNAYPEAKMIAVQAEIKLFLTQMLSCLPQNNHNCPKNNFLNKRKIVPTSITVTSLINPHALMQAIQEIVINNSDAIVMADSGNAFTWTTYLLRFNEPGRYRLSPLWGSMGHFSCGVIGAAIARKCKAVVVTGDGSILMANEISTAVRFNIPALWIILNDARYNMCEQGGALLGLRELDTAIPPTDFVGMARSLGANGISITSDDEISMALTKAMQAPGPFILDVHVDPSVLAPITARVKSLKNNF